ncbi:MAG: hypothetical protein K2H93_01740, partial [Oscillospiraceae bacterium]|nr:hypothetical protein [Oscillospiraceae bacterium]
MTLTTILLFGLATMGVILLIMIIISSSKTMFAEKNADSIDDDEDENNSVLENKKIPKNISKNSEFQTETA